MRFASFKIGDAALVMHSCQLKWRMQEHFNLSFDGGGGGLNRPKFFINFFIKKFS